MMVLALIRMPSDIVVITTILLSIFFIYIYITYHRAIYEHFKLYFIILIHGKYSFEFVHFFAIKNLGNPLNSCIRDEIPFHFKCFYDKSDLEITNFSSNSTITFKDTQFLTSSKSLLKRHHKPDCFSATNLDGVVIKIFGYYETIEKKSIRSLYYFVNDKFVMGEYVIPEESNKLIKSLLDALSSKYLGNIPITDTQIQIIGKDSNKIVCIASGFNFLVKYFYTGNSEFDKLLRNHFNKKEVKTKIPDIPNNELINRF